MHVALALHLTLQVMLRGPGEHWALGKGRRSGHPFFRSCFRSVEIEYDELLVKNVLADKSGSAFDVWFHSSMLSSLNGYTLG